jgi:hypothetical protein
MSAGWVPEAVPAAGDRSLLHTAACGADAWAFGIGLREDGFETLVFRRAGSGWRRLPTPDIGRVNRAHVHGAEDAWLVGDGTSLHWDGRSWTEFPMAPAGPVRTQFFGLARFGEDLWAAGYAPGRDRRPSGRGTVQRFDGEQWTDQPVPTLPELWSLAGIGGVAADDLWAVGRDTILHHDGRRWEPVPLPATDADGLALADVVALAPDDVWAAGYRRPQRQQAPVRREPIITHWDGNKWSLVDVPHGPGQVKQLVPAGEGIWAVGYTGSRPFLLHWNGSGWWPTEEPNLDPNAERLSLHGATLLPDGRLLVVGASAAGTNTTWPFAASCPG